MPSGHAARVVTATFISSILAWFSEGLYSTAFEMGTASESPIPLNSTRHMFMLPFGLAGRVIGAFIFGQIGDAFSRRSGLVPSLVIVGVFTCIMGFVTADALHLKRPGLWATLRFIQGIGVGGQWPGTTLLAYEMAGSNEWHQSLAGSIAQAGVTLGLGCATYVVYYMATTERWCSWMWNVFCGIPILLVPLALFIWRAVGLTQDEPPVRSGRLPCVELVLVHSGVLTMSVFYIGIEALGLTVLCSGWWALFPTSNRHAVIQALRYSLVAMFVVSAVGLIFGSTIGRFRARAKYVWSAPVLGIAICIWLGLLNPTGGQLPYLYAYPVILGPALGLVEGCLGAVLASEFNRSVRYSGLGIVYHTCHLIIQTTFPLAGGYMVSSQNAQGSGTQGKSAFSLVIVASTIMLASIMSAVAAHASKWTPIWFYVPPRLKLRKAIEMSLSRDTHSEDAKLPDDGHNRRGVEYSDDRDYETGHL